MKNYAASKRKGAIIIILLQNQTTGFPQALEIMENLKKSLKKAPCMEKSWNLKKKT